MKRWLRELKLNVDGFRRNAQAYIKDGGFKEIKETLQKRNVDFGVPEELLKEGRKLELQYAEIAMKLADKYEQLLQYIKNGAGIG